MKTKQTAKAILQDWLRSNGYDGLIDVICECGCKTEDLMLCEGSCATCVPAFIGSDPSGEAPYWMFMEKQNTPVTLLSNG